MLISFLNLMEGSLLRKPSLIITLLSAYLSHKVSDSSLECLQSSSSVEELSSGTRIIVESVLSSTRASTRLSANIVSNSIFSELSLPPPPMTKVTCHYCNCRRESCIGIFNDSPCTYYFMKSAECLNSKVTHRRCVTVMNIVPSWWPKPVRR